jgi:hypothetical protein
LETPKLTFERMPENPKTSKLKTSTPGYLEILNFEYPETHILECILGWSVFVWESFKRKNLLGLYLVLKDAYTY